MTNTARYHDIMRRHQAFLHELTDGYQDTLQKLEQYRGSEGYAKALEEVEDTKRQALTEARKKANDEMEEVLAAMETTWANKPMEPPSTEQTNLLTVLRGMKQISKDQFKQAMVTMRGNRVAEEALAEVAHDHQELLPLSYQMDSTRVKETIGSLRRQGQRYIFRAHDLSDSTRSSYINGVNGDRMKTDPILWQLTGDNSTSTEADTMRVFGAVQNLAAFQDAVNAAE